jgi:hypothetical protein
MFWWNRPDGTIVRDLPPTKRIMPYIMRGRNESAFYFEQTMSLHKTDAFIRAFNDAYPQHPIGVQHILMRSIVEVMTRYPTLNRFVVGGRLYQRSEIWFSYSAKQNLKEGSPLIVVKRRFTADEPFVDMVAGMAEQLRDHRFGDGISRSDREVELIMKLPGLGRRTVLAIGRFADAFGLLPRSFIDEDPLYASAFFANLGSVGQDSGYHHLYEYGSIGVFGVIGKPRAEPGSPTSGPGRRRTLSVKWTFDERTEDGLVAGYGLRLCKQFVEDPVGVGHLELPGAVLAPDPREQVPREAAGSS